MSLIKFPDAFPQMLYAILRVVHQRGEATMDEIAAAIIPNGLASPADVEKSRGRPKTATRVACAAGMLEDTGDAYRVTGVWQRAAQLESDPEVFVATLAEQLRVDAPEGLQDLARAAAWVLLQPAFKARLDVDTLSQLLRQFPEGRAPSNPTKEQLVPMATWLDLLGLGQRWTLGRGWALVPDPTRLVRRLFCEVVKVGDEAMVATLLQRWTACHPVLPGGGVSAVVARELGMTPWTLQGELPDAWALAFQRLERAGVVELHHDADALSVYTMTDFSGAGQSRRFERIRRVK
jgi:hypothetical protein